MTDPIKWSNAPDRTSWGASMRVADIEIDKDHTLTLFCEASQTAKVDAMFAEVERLREAVAAEREACAWVCINEANVCELSSLISDQDKVSCLRSTAFRLSVCADAIRARQSNG